MDELIKEENDRFIDGKWYRYRMNDPKVRREPLEKKTCLKCKQIYLARVARWGRQESRFCFKKCQYKFMVGENSYYYKTGKTNSNGYIIIDKDGEQFLEHRLIMEKYLKRKLDRFEVVHHIDHNKKNNNIKNLQVLSFYQHNLIHHPKRNSKGQFVKENNI